MLTSSVWVHGWEARSREGREGREEEETEEEGEDREVRPRMSRPPVQMARMMGQLLPRVRDVISLHFLLWRLQLLECGEWIVECGV